MSWTANYYRDTLGFHYERFWQDPPAFCMVKCNGARIVRDLCNQPHGCRDFEVEDCNGYRLCFGQVLQAS